MRLLADKMGLLPDDLTGVLRDLELVRVEVFGTPGERAASMDKPVAEDGVPFTFKPRYVDDFTNPAKG